MLCIRHTRGHGIHSPFTYRVVRQAIMKRRVLDPQALRNINLKSLKIAKRERSIIKNIFTLNRYEDCIVVNQADTKFNMNRMYLMAESCNPEFLKRNFAMLNEGVDQCCVIITGINRNAERYKISKQAAKECPGVGLILHKMVVIFPSDKLNQNYFRVRY